MSLSPALSTVNSEFFANSVKRHICRIKNPLLGHDLSSSVNNRVISLFRAGFIFMKLHRSAKFRENKTVAKFCKSTVWLRLSVLFIFCLSGSLRLSHLTGFTRMSVRSSKDSEVPRLYDLSTNMLTWDEPTSIIVRIIFNIGLIIGFWL